MIVIFIILYAISVIGTLLFALASIHNKRELTLGDALLYLMFVLTPIFNSMMFVVGLILNTDIVIWERKVK